MNVTCPKGVLGGGTPVTVMLNATKDGCSAIATTTYTLKTIPSAPSSLGTSACLPSGANPSIQTILNFTLSAVVDDTLSVSSGSGLSDCKIYPGPGATGGWISKQMLVSVAMWVCVCVCVWILHWQTHRRVCGGVQHRSGKATNTDRSRKH